LYKNRESAASEAQGRHKAEHKNLNVYLSSFKNKSLVYFKELLYTNLAKYTKF